MLIKACRSLSAKNCHAKGRERTPRIYSQLRDDRRVIVGHKKFPQFARCKVRGVQYYPCSMVLRQIFCRFTGSAAQTHCAQRPQLVSKKFLEEEIFTGTNFRELAFDSENRENFLLYGSL